MSTNVKKKQTNVPAKYLNVSTQKVILNRLIDTNMVFHKASSHPGSYFCNCSAPAYVNRGNHACIGLHHAAFDLILVIPFRNLKNVLAINQ